MRSHTKIGLLVAVHAIGGLVLSLQSTGRMWAALSVVGFLGLVFAQGALVGMWGALGTPRLLARLCLVSFEIAYLSILVGHGSGADDFGGIVFVILLSGVPVIGSMLTLAVTRWWLRLGMTQRDSMGTQREGLQFSLWHLFALTGGVAVALSVGRLIRNFSGEDWIEWTIFFAVIGTCVVGVQLAVLWATLCAGRPALRMAVVLPFVLGAGLIPPFYLFPHSLAWEFMAWPAMFVWQLAVTAASLLVVRSNGWRIVRRDRERTNARLVCQEAGEPGNEP